MGIFFFFIFYYLIFKNINLKYYWLAEGTIWWFNKKNSDIMGKWVEKRGKGEIFTVPGGKKYHFWKGGGAKITYGGRLNTRLCHPQFTYIDGLDGGLSWESFYMFLDCIRYRAEAQVPQQGVFNSPGQTRTNRP